MTPSLCTQAGAVDSCDTVDCSDLWHELEIMKKIDTHPNICNLLACCTTEGIVIITLMSEDLLSSTQLRFYTPLQL